MYSKGISWIDDCRIPFANSADADYTLSAKYPVDIDNKKSEGWGTKKTGNVCIDTGRFPANILVSDDMLNDGIYHKTGIAKIPQGKNIYGGNSLLNSKTKDFGGEFGAIAEKGGSNSRYYNIDKWFENLLD